MARNPKYMQVAQDLKEKLATYSYNQKLPTEAELVRMYDVSRQTIRVCLDILREENIIRKVGGSPEVKKHLEDMGFVTGGIVRVVAEMGGNLIVDVKDISVHPRHGGADIDFVAMNKTLQDVVMANTGIGQLASVGKQIEQVIKTFIPAFASLRRKTLSFIIVLHRLLQPQRADPVFLLVNGVGF